MKAVQVMLDEELLHQLDSDSEVRRKGRSAILRLVIAEYLERRRRQAISEQYRKAYSENPGLGEEFEGWENEGEWPPE